MDPSSDPTGNMNYVLTEVYESQAGVEDHWKQGSENWKDFPALVEWAASARLWRCLLAVLSFIRSGSLHDGRLCPGPTLKMKVQEIRSSKRAI
ncbi:hypothetical protein MYX76_16560 [Desulfobacterota bacterium AH_259_B03_O07]|nr:hypothetical protein [Desulfobacterota bacterium AH_259_B03_O07]